MNLRPHPAAAAALALLAALGSATAADRTWDGNGGNSNWSFGSLTGGNTNWTHNALPGQQALLNGDRPVFAGSTRLVNTNDYNNLSVAGLLFKSDAGAFTLGGNALASTDNIVNTSSSHQRLSFANLVVGADQTWHGGSGGLTIDHFTLDRHTLELSGTVNLASSAASTVIGRTQAATLRAGAGSRIATGLTFLADQAGSSATVVLDQGAGWEAAGLYYVGSRGRAELSLQRGSTLASEGGHVGRFAGASGAVVIGADSRWTATGTPLNIGYEGSGAVRVESGGSLQVGRLSLGQAGGTGTLTFEGSATQLPPGGIGTPTTIGGAGWGRLVQRGSSQTDLGEVSLAAPGPAADGQGSAWTLHDSARSTAEDVTVGSGSLLELANSANLSAHSLRVQDDGELRLNGGQLSVDSLTLSDPSRLQWRAGRLSLGVFVLNGDSTFGAVFTVPGGGWLVARNGAVLRAGTVLNLSQPGAQFTTPTITLEGATILGPLNLTSHGMSGHGSVLGRVNGGNPARDLTVSGGNLTLGTLAQPDAVRVGHRLAVTAGRTALLLSADEAELSGGAYLQGGSLLATVNGARLPAGETLQVAMQNRARVQGRFINNGAVSVGNGGTLTFEDDVSGSGTYSGHVVFSDGFTPGRASTSFGGGDVEFDGSSALSILIDSTGEGRLVDIGSIGLAGTLALHFDAGFAARAAAGLVLDLLDFQHWSGGFDAAQVQVLGFDRSRLDFSQFTLDGRIAVAAVPEPSGWMPIGLGLLTIALRRRARTRMPRQGWR